MTYPYDKVRSREEFSQALDAVFRLDKRLRSLEALIAISMKDPKAQAKCKCMAYKVTSRKESYLAQWDDAKDEVERDAIVGAVVFHPEDYKISELEISKELA